MYSYEKEQEKLHRMMQEMLSSDEEGIVQYDDDSEDDGDNLEIQNEDTDTEQEFSDGETNASSVEGPYFVGKNNVTKWRKMVPPKNVRTRAENIIKLLPGVKSSVKDPKSPMEIWKHFFSDDINIILENTNLSFQNVKDSYSRERDCKDTKGPRAQPLGFQSAGPPRARPLGPQGAQPPGSSAPFPRPLGPRELGHSGWDPSKAHTTGRTLRHQRRSKQRASSDFLAPGNMHHPTFRRQQAVQYKMASEITLKELASEMENIENKPWEAYQADESGNPYQKFLWGIRNTYFPEKMKKRMWTSQLDNQMDCELLAGLTYYAGQPYKILENALHYCNQYFDPHKMFKVYGIYRSYEMDQFRDNVLEWFMFELQDMKE
ncbi:hypothetical protein QE152_g38665 [Popillia japonica]|uniref:Uncharacterized protein n=1 Tax=Popillia japonica TaxID=7064 RepID=A0AAW1HWN9_POPJA